MLIPGKRAEDILHYTRPTTKKGLRSFLSTVIFYRRYVQLFADDTAILSPATCTAAPVKNVWSKDMDSAFTHICE